MSENGCGWRDAKNSRTPNGPTWKLTLSIRDLADRRTQSKSLVLRGVRGCSSLRNSVLFLVGRCCCVAVASCRRCRVVVVAVGALKGRADGRVEKRNSEGIMIIGRRAVASSACLRRRELGDTQALVRETC